MPVLEPLTGIILAGGKGRRMGYLDKGLVLLNNQPLYQHVVTRLKLQVDTIVINANQNQSQYALSGYAVICDKHLNFPGPLAGLYAGLQYSSTTWNLFVPCDTPFIPNNLALRLWQGLVCSNQPAAYVVSEGQMYPTHLLLHKEACNIIAQQLDQKEYRLRTLLKRLSAQPVDFPDCGLNFENINTLSQRDRWQQQQ